ncbi:putative quinol monooxygenase [Phenylobacterium sp.]|uniref:putative quinol monooxygenase n=1 Tax=Phenylobacterium sp. TaxID=1871053 RepID=UPI0025F49B05|nr:putative quinol monooxygenase [Phenylobacterium sp.]
MLVVTGSVTARPETFEALLEAALEHVRRSRLEPGCLSHSVHIDCEDPMRLFFYEEWEDRAALDVHFAVPESLAYMKVARELAASGTRVRILPVAERKHDG